MECRSTGTRDKLDGEISFHLERRETGISTLFMMIMMKFPDHIVGKTNGCELDVPGYDGVDTFVSTRLYRPLYFLYFEYPDFPENKGGLI